MSPFRVKASHSPTVLVEMSAHRVVLDSESPLPSCPTCDELLDLHQPDESRPAQLLAICLSCSKWYLWLDEPIDGHGIALVELPSHETLRERMPVEAGLGRVGREAESA